LNTRERPEDAKSGPETMEAAWEAKIFDEGALEIMRGAQRAGEAILEIYRGSPQIRYKDDRSPVTDADRASEDILVECLSKLMPGVPVVAEERMASGERPQVADLFFVVDPLDGTKEFLKFNGEFAINVALIAEGEPVFGLIYGPDRNDCFVTLERGKAFRCTLTPATPIVNKESLVLKRLTGEPAPERSFTALISRSHPRPEALAFLERHGNPARIALGSSLKFGLLASGEADVYPRFGPTSEWDTAAGQAILEAAGGSVLTMDGHPLRYGNCETGFENPPFLAWRRRPGAGLSAG
jgi:3'(2'), 5'-bisphosphate nucleotidase